MMPRAPIAAIDAAGWLPLAIGAAVAVGWFAFASRRAAAATATAPAQAPAPAGEPPRAVRRKGPPRAVFLVGLAAAAVAFVATERLPLAAAFLVAWVGMTRVLWARREARRFAAEETHALAAIGTATRALRAGIPLPGVIGILAGEAQGEAGEAFREVIQREAMGEELPSAIRRVMLRSRLAALRAFGLAILVQVTAGGNIADASDRLARSLVERNRVRRRARTIVAYGRAAAVMLCLLPAAIIPLLSLNVDGYAEFLFERPFGNMLLAASAALIATGLVVVQRMCRIDRVNAWRTG